MLYWLCYSYKHTAKGTYYSLAAPYDFYVSKNEKEEIVRKKLLLKILKKSNTLPPYHEYPDMECKEPHENYEEPYEITYD